MRRMSYPEIDMLCRREVPSFEIYLSEPFRSIRGRAMSAKQVATWYRWDDMAREELNERLSRRLITGDQLMLAHVYLKKGCVVPKHAHTNEQLTYVLEGSLKFFVGADNREEIVVHAGEVLHLPGNLPREAHALEDTFDGAIF